jgi:hypothetical protein
LVQILGFVPTVAALLVAALVAVEVGLIGVGQLGAVVGGVEEISPECCDSISRAIKAVDPTVHTLVREAIPKNNYNRPYLRTEEARELLTWQNTLSKSNGESVPAHFDGVTTLIPLNSFLEASTDDR